MRYLLFFHLCSLSICDSLVFLAHCAESTMAVVCTPPHIMHHTLRWRENCVQETTAQEAEAQHETLGKTCTMVRMMPQQSPFIIDGARDGIDLPQSLRHQGAPIYELRWLKERCWVDSVMQEEEPHKGKHQKKMCLHPMLSIDVMRYKDHKKTVCQEDLPS